MQYNDENLKKLLDLEPNKDFVYAAERMPVFKMHGGYFGHYTYGDPYNPWTVNCIEGVSPTVFRPHKLKYAGRFDMPDNRSDKLFVFSDGDDLCRSGYAMPWYFDGPPFYRGETFSSGAFRYFLKEKNVLDFDRVFFDEEECILKCRTLNQSYCLGDGVGKFGKWYEKTLDDMQSQLRECLNSDYVVDPIEKLKRTVEGKNEED